MVSVDVKQHSTNHEQSNLRSRVKVEVAVLGFPSLISLMVSVDVKQQLKKRRKRLHTREDKDPHTETKQTDRKREWCLVSGYHGDDQHDGGGRDAPKVRAQLLGHK